MEIWAFGSDVVIRYGVYGTKHPVVYNKHYESRAKAVSVAQSRWNHKLTEGYKPIEDLIHWEEYPDDMKIGYLKEALPKSKIDENNILLPMKAKPFQKTKKRTYPMFAQPKINGLRGVLRWEEINEGVGLFEKLRDDFVIRSKENLIYILPIPADEGWFLDTKLVYDGEVYIPGKRLNEIKASIPMKLKSGTVTKNSIPTPKNARFIIFDLAMPDLPQSSRLTLLDHHGGGVTKISTVTEEYLRDVISGVMTGESVVHFLPTFTVENDDEAIRFANICIDCGFEGAVFRDPDAEYAFGHRVPTMLKYKLTTTTQCEVLDIRQVNQIGDRSYIQFILKNDINDEIFEATPLGNEAARQLYLEEKDSYIGRMALVKFYERSGIGDFPFHGNVIRVL